MSAMTKSTSLNVGEVRGGNRTVDLRRALLATENDSPVRAVKFVSLDGRNFPEANLKS